MTSVGDAAEAGKTHKKIYPLHTTPLLFIIIISRGVSESSVTLLISKRSPLFVLLMRKEIKFEGADVSAQGTIDGLEEVLEGDIATIGRPDLDNPGKMDGSDGKGWKWWSCSRFDEYATREGIVVEPDGGRMFHHVPMHC